VSRSRKLGQYPEVFAAWTSLTNGGDVNASTEELSQARRDHQFVLFLLDTGEFLMRGG
jgi:hypothetical protein